MICIQQVACFGEENLPFGINKIGKKKNPEEIHRRLKIYWKYLIWKFWEIIKYIVGIMNVNGYIKAPTLKLRTFKQFVAKFKSFKGF